MSPHPAPGPVTRIYSQRARFGERPHSPSGTENEERPVVVYAEKHPEPECYDLPWARAFSCQRAGPTQIQKRVQFDRGLGRTKVSPRKEAQAQVDHRGIERVNGLIELQSKRFRGVQPACSTNQTLCPIGVDSPIATLVGVGKSAAPNMASKPHLIKQLGARTQRRLQIAQTLPECELSKCHRKPLVVTSEILDPCIALIALDAAAKDLAVAQAHHLRKHGRSGHARRMRLNLADRITKPFL